MHPQQHGPHAALAPGDDRARGPATRPPGVAAAAAVLGFVEGGSALAVVVYALGEIGSEGLRDDDIAPSALVLLALLAVGGLLLPGGLFLVRGTGRRLLLGGTITELAALLVLGIVVLASTSNSGYGYRSDAPAVLAGFVLAAVVPVVRLVLALQPTVRTWLTGRAAERDAVPPVWSAEHQAWVPNPARRGTPGAVVALLAPVAVLLLVVLVVLVTTGPPEYVY